MKEHELNTIMKVVSDPIKCAINLNDKRLVNDIEKMIRVFEINKQQGNRHFMLALRSMATLKLVMSNN